MIPAVIKKSIMRKLIMSQRSKFGGMVIRAVSLCMQKI
ncbi:wbdJ domain protein [Escherichia coli DEC6C]|nr:wbdJ domain protein [Escherichia coli DEC6C]